MSLAFSGVMGGGAAAMVVAECAAVARVALRLQAKGEWEVKERPERCATLMAKKLE